MAYSAKLIFVAKAELVEGPVWHDDAARDAEPLAGGLSPVLAQF